LVEQVLTAPGRLPMPVRRAVYEGVRDRLATSRPDGVPEALASFAATVAERSDQVTVDDVAALRAAGLSEDQVFEAVVVAAVGAAAVRRDTAHRLLVEAADASRRP
jgi:alkylhydroperoxidase family enzyme